MTERSVAIEYLPGNCQPMALFKTNSSSMERTFAIR